MAWKWFALAGYLVIAAGIVGIALFVGWAVLRAPFARRPLSEHEQAIRG